MINWRALFFWSWCMCFWLVIVLAAIGRISFWWIPVEFMIGVVGLWIAILIEDYQIKQEAKNYRKSLEK